MSKTPKENIGLSEQKGERTLPVFKNTLKTRCTKLTSCLEVTLFFCLQALISFCLLRRYILLWLTDTKENSVVCKKSCSLCHCRHRPKYAVLPLSQEQISLQHMLPQLVFVTYFNSNCSSCSTLVLAHSC